MALRETIQALISQARADRQKSRAILSHAVKLIFNELPSQETTQILLELASTDIFRTDANHIKISTFLTSQLRTIALALQVFQAHEEGLAIFIDIVAREATLAGVTQLKVTIAKVIEEMSSFDLADLELVVESFTEAMADGLHPKDLENCVEHMMRLVRNKLDITNEEYVQLITIAENVIIAKNVEMLDVLLGIPMDLTSIRSDSSLERADGLVSSERVESLSSLESLDGSERIEGPAALLAPPEPQRDSLARARLSAEEAVEFYKLAGFTMHYWAILYESTRRFRSNSKLFRLKPEVLVTLSAVGWGTAIVMGGASFTSAFTLSVACYAISKNHIVAQQMETNLALKILLQTCAHNPLSVSKESALPQLALHGAMSLLPPQIENHNHTKLTNFAAAIISCAAIPKIAFGLSSVFLPLAIPMGLALWIGVFEITKYAMHGLMSIPVIDTAITDITSAVCGEGSIYELTSKAVDVTMSGVERVLCLVGEKLPEALLNNYDN